MPKIINKLLESLSPFNRVRDIKIYLNEIQSRNKRGGLLQSNRQNNLNSLRTHMVTEQHRHQELANDYAVTAVTAAAAAAVYANAFINIKFDTPVRISVATTVKNGLYQACGPCEMTPEQLFIFET